MATLINSTRRAATEFSLYPRGINFGMSNFAGARQTGVDQVSPAAQIRSGQMVANSASGLVLATGTDVLGVLKHDAVNNSVAVQVFEEATLADAGFQLSRNRLVSGSLSVRTAADFGATPLAVTTDYTVDLANGTITRAGGSSTADGTTIFVCYAWQLDASSYEFEGRPFHSEYGDNMPASEEQRAVLIQGSFDLFTSEWEQSEVYALTGTNSNLYCNANGRFDSSATSNQFVGKVIQLPTRDDIYLGLVFAPGPVAA